MAPGTKQNSDGTVEIMIPLPPYTKKNSQQIFHKRKGAKMVPFISPSSQYKQYEKDCGIFLKPLEISFPVNIEAHYYMASRRVVDLTNLNEALHDILVKNGVLTDDKCQIVVSTDGSKVFYDKEKPRTEVLITKTDPTFPIPREKSKKKPIRSAREEC